MSNCPETYPVNSCLGAKNSYKDLITFVKDRAGHDRRYAIDATKIENDLGWNANENFDSGILKTIDWYLENHNFTNSEEFASSNV